MSISYCFCKRTWYNHIEGKKYSTVPSFLHRLLSSIPTTSCSFPSSSHPISLEETTMAVFFFLLLLLFLAWDARCRLPPRRPEGREEGKGREKALLLFAAAADRPTLYHPLSPPPSPPPRRLERRRRTHSHTHTHTHTHIHTRKRKEIVDSLAPNWTEEGNEHATRTMAPREDDRLHHLQHHHRHYQQLRQHPGEEGGRSLQQQQQQQHQGQQQQPRARLRRLVRAHVAFRRRLLRGLGLVFLAALFVVILVLAHDLKSAASVRPQRAR